MLGLGLLVPAGALPIHLDRAPAATEASAAGEIPVALQDKIRLDLTSRATLSGEAPVVVTAAAVAAPLRSALDRLPGPTVELVRAPRRRPLPGRSLIVALLAISLLTGPLAESLPGERGAGTLEVLLSASLTRAELVAGKWLAWTAYGSALAGIAAISGMFSGAAPVGLWPLALPLVVGVSAAVGLWLVRGAADVVSGAAVPMRVLPMLAVGSGILAWIVADSSPVLGAAVPMGGALLVASGALSGAAALLSAALGSAASVALLLSSTAAVIDQGGVARSARGADLAAGLLGVGLTWLAVAGPGLWAVAGNPNLVLPRGASIAAGGVCAGLLAGVWLVRGSGLALVPRHREDDRLGESLTRRCAPPSPGGRGGKFNSSPSPSGRRCPKGADEGIRSTGQNPCDRALGWGGRRGALMGAAAGVGVGLVLAALDTLPIQLQGPLWMAPLRERLLCSPIEGGPLALAAVVLGQTLLFRGLLLERLGLAGSVALWVLAVAPFDPVQGAVGGLALAGVARGLGLAPAMVAMAVMIGVRGVI